MSKIGHRIATLFSRPRPASAFASAAEAEVALGRQRDEGLRALERAAVFGAAFSPDYTVESLRALDGWYQDLWQRDAFADVGVGREEFERWMALYYGAVAVRNHPDARWVVVPHPGAAGRFDLGVRRGDDEVTLTGDTFRDHYKTFMLSQRPRQSIYRQYRDDWK